MDEEGGHDEEEDVGDSVDELSNVGREGIVLLTPVHRTGPPVSVAPPISTRHARRPDYQNLNSKLVNW